MASADRRAGRTEYLYPPHLSGYVASAGPAQEESNQISTGQGSRPIPQLDAIESFFYYFNGEQFKNRVLTGVIFTFTYRHV